MYLIYLVLNNFCTELLFNSLPLQTIDILDLAQSGSRLEDLK